MPAVLLASQKYVHPCLREEGGRGGEEGDGESGPVELMFVKIFFQYLSSSAVKTIGDQTTMV